MYPGDNSSPGINVSFTTGPWVILGVNGLGKSTLLLVLRHLLSGPVRIRPAGFTGERSDLLSIDPRMFAVRVADDASTASASATVRFGAGKLSIKRRLHDLSLMNATWHSDGVEQVLADEDEYRQRIATGMGVSQFEDALRAIERVTFYLEERDPLVWDVAAQFELFRGLLTPSISTELRRLEAVIVSTDSFSRNLNATLYRLVSRREKQRQKHAQSAATLATLAKVSAELESAEAEELKLRGELDAKLERRSDLRIEYKRAARATDEAGSEYDRVKFEAYRHAFASVGPNEQYIFLKIIRDKICAACGSLVPEKAEEFEHLQAENRCLVCGSSRPEDGGVSATGRAAQARAETAYHTFEASQIARDQLEQKYNEAEQLCREAELRLEECQQVVDTKRREIRKLRKKLPSDTQLELSRQEDDIERLRAEVLEARRERDEAEDQITDLLEQLKKATEAIRENLEQSFHARAQDFFAEQIRLVYSPRRDRIGQGGRLFEFPAFEVEMTSAATGGEFVRRHPNQVSLSQREYIDLIFRMSLAETIAGGQASFVVDGPESSLDAVFAERAGHLFARFSKLSTATTMLACNVVEGAFIPCALADYRSVAERASRVINLFEIAAPTAALRELNEEYATAVTLILQKGCAQ